MKPDIDQLIEYYEAEQTTLDALIKECLLDWDYKRAHYHAVALKKVNRKLQILRNLKDPFYRDKTFLEDKKLAIEKLISDESLKDAEEFLRSNIDEIDKKVAALKSKKVPGKPENQDFDDAIFDLVERKISGFKFHLKKQENLYMQFKLKEESSLVISFTPIDQLGEFSYFHSSVTKLKLIGFQINNKTNCYEYIYNIADFTNSIFLKTLVSRVVFDALFYEDLDKPAYIEIE